MVVIKIMYKLSAAIIVLSVVATLAGAQLELAKNYVCTEDFCDTYRESNECDTLKIACRVQNATHNGIVFPSATPCSCCKTCVENLRLGEDCSVGGLGYPVPAGICGPGLYCKVAEGDEHPTCQPMLESSKCFTAQKAYDEQRQQGLIGHLMQRPDCDGDGNFQPLRCIPGQTCYCVDEDGKRIFGEAVHTASIQISMRCECSRLAAKARTLLNSQYPVLTSRCDSKGSFDQLQCVEDMCVCVDMHTGRPSSDLRNVTRGLASLPCFDKRLHENTTYLRDCENVKIAQIMDISEYTSGDFNVLEFDRDICQPDGFYDRIQLHPTGGYQYCADRDGAPIEEYRAPLSTPLAATMNCKCARARKLLLDSKSLEVPECCPNGNYKRLACRRGECYCVNEDGEQVGVERPEKDKQKLPCYNGGDYCPLVVA
uniref:Thyroglobulin type-1 domain-containing protein n=1 Tax=Anopheles farauti TaxID=69004 RepID=A0A182QB15_9DIPT